MRVQPPSWWELVLGFSLILLPLITIAWLLLMMRR